MSGVITTGNHPRALLPGIKAHWGRSYNEHPQEWEQIFDVETSNKAYEEDVELTGFGLAPIKAQGASIQYDSESQGDVARYTHVTYALGFIVTEEEIEDNLYPVVGKRRAEGLAFAMRQSKEIVHANMLNRGHNASYTGGDGKSLLATDHPTLDGSQSNKLAVAADLSEASLEDMMIQIGKAKNSRGRQIKITPKCLIIPPDLEFDAERIINSNLRPNTDLNDNNAMKKLNKLSGGAVMNHYLTDADAWFIKTDAPRGLIHMKRKAITFGKDKDFDTSNAKFKASERYSRGWTDWRGIYGSEGAG